MKSKTTCHRAESGEWSFGYQILYTAPYRWLVIHFGPWFWIRELKQRYYPAPKPTPCEDDLGHRKLLQVQRENPPRQLYTAVGEFLTFLPVVFNHGVEYFFRDDMGFKKWKQ